MINVVNIHLFSFNSGKIILQDIIDGGKIIRIKTAYSNVTHMVAWL